MNKVKVHREICNLLTETYQAKNADYGDSFSKLRKEFPNAVLIRIFDKFSRLKILLEDGTEQQVKEESIYDTFLDLANYVIMELVERRVEQQKGREDDGR